MLDDFLNYRWPELWAQCQKESPDPRARLVKAMLAAAWWQDVAYARSLLPSDLLIDASRDKLLLFARTVIALCSGDGDRVDQLLPRLKRLDAPEWMVGYLELENMARRRQFARLGKRYAQLSAQAKAQSWPYVACLQSLDQPHIDPEALLAALEAQPHLPELGVILKARLFAAKGSVGQAAALLHERLHHPERHIARIAAYHAGYLAQAANDLSATLRCWDSAAREHFMDRPTLERWLHLSLSTPVGWSSTPQRAAHAQQLTTLADPSEQARAAASLATYELIYRWIAGDYPAAYQLVAQHHRFQDMEPRPAAHPLDDRNQQIFFRYILRLATYWQFHQDLYPANHVARRLHVLGESHCLSPANAVFSWIDGPTKATAHFVMGIKMWHLACGFSNFHQEALRLRIASLPDHADWLLTIGEIDCRPNEGIWRHVQKHKRALWEVIGKTVDGYLDWIHRRAEPKRPNSITIQGIPAPGYALSGRYDPGDRQGFLAMIQAVNDRLKQQTLQRGWRFLDVYHATANADGVGNGKWHLDGFHLQPGFYRDARAFLLTA